ncbi:MAG: outer membrane protein assembly factor BamD [Planctomycetota bacterium]|jgi:outer membrane protein assembly factor BamD
MRLFILLATVFVLVACGPAKEIDITANWTVEEFYNEARSQLDKGNYLTAIEHYETLESRFPFGNYATQAQIDVAYAYFKFDEPDSALTALDRFIKLNPRHENVDYAYYLKGLVNYERGGTILDALAERDMADFNRKILRTSYNEFRQLLQRFPASQYAADSRKRMIYLRNQLARSDLKIARYYASREAWVAVANRTKLILKKFQGTTTIRPTLELQLEAYQKLGLDELAEDTQRILELNYGDDV